MTDPINLFGRRSVNADILAQLRGVRPQHMTEEEAMANPSNPNAAPVTIHSEDLREKVARIILGPKSHWNTHFEDDLLIKWPHYPETARALAKADQILSLISSIKEGGTEVLSAVGSGLTPLVPSRVPEPGHATPSLVGQSDIHYITAALSWYDGGPAGADVQSAWRRIRDACGYTGAPDEGPHHAPDTREGSKAEGHGRPDSKPSHKDSQ